MPVQTKSLQQILHFHHMLAKLIMLKLMKNLNFKVFKLLPFLKAKQKFSLMAITRAFQAFPFQLRLLEHHHRLPIT
jgi:hypothetical protein